MLWAASDGVTQYSASLPIRGVQAGAAGSARLLAAGFSRRAQHKLETNESGHVQRLRDSPLSCLLRAEKQRMLQRRLSGGGPEPSRHAADVYT